VLTVELCGPEATEIVLRLTQEAFRDQRELDPPSGVSRETAVEVRDDLTMDEAALGRLDGTPVACLRMAAAAGHLHVRRLAVLPALQGRGLGREMMAWAEAVARRRGLAAVTVGVRLALTGNRAFYARLGYEELGEHAHPGYDHPTWVEMRKRL
jgi:GNAT superfamily N-acetyltransferase